MGIRELGEAMICQSLEDLSSKTRSGEAVEFFEGKDYNVCARIAGMSAAERIRLLVFAERIIGRRKTKGSYRKLTSYGNYPTKK